MCTFKKAIFFEVEVDAQKGVPRFREILTKDVLVSFELHLHLFFCHMVIVLNDSLSIPLRVCIWVSDKLEAHGVLMGSLEFCSPIGVWLIIPTRFQQTDF